MLKSHFSEKGSVSVDEKIIIALVAGVPSFLVAVIGLLASRYATKRSSQTTLELEALKQSIHETSQAQEIADIELRDFLDGCKKAMQAIQNLKDEIQLILSSLEDSLDAPEAIDRVQRVRDHLIDVHGAIHPVLGEQEAALHRAKTAAIEVYNLLSSKEWGRRFGCR